MQHSSYRVTARQGAHDLDVGEAQEVVARADLHACSRCRPPRMRGAWGPALVLVRSMAHASRVLRSSPPVGTALVRGCSISLGVGLCNFLAWGGIILGSLGCGQSGTCGHAPAPAPTITVTDSATGVPICDATVAALLLQEDYTVIVQPTLSSDDAPSCVYYLIGAPVGTYNITASRAGYQSNIVRGFVELNDACGALGPDPPAQMVTIRLTPG
jgi:hypothetical protein